MFLLKRHPLIWELVVSLARIGKKVENALMTRNRGDDIDLRICFDYKGWSRQAFSQYFPKGKSDD